MKRIAWQFVLTSLVAVGLPGTVNAVEEIDEAVEDVKAAMKEVKAASFERPTDDGRMRRLETAIANGEAASRRLTSEIAALERERNDLQRVQAILASGLIGALVTAAVAVLGALSSRGRSKAERDLKRLEVLEKSRNLQKSGIDIPADIIRLYHASPTPASGTAAGTPEPEG